LTAVDEVIQEEERGSQSGFLSKKFTMGVMFAGTGGFDDITRSLANNDPRTVVENRSEECEKNNKTKSIRNIYTQKNHTLVGRRLENKEFNTSD